LHAPLRSAGKRAFTAQRLTHGRQYGRDRGRAFSTGRKVAGIFASPIVPFLMTWRIFRLVFQKRRCRIRVLVTLPIILWFNLVWAYAEARGYADELRK